VTATPAGVSAGADRDRLAAAVAARPRDPALRRALAVSLAKAGEAKAALDQYRALLGLLPNDPDAAADAGLMAQRCGLQEELLPVVRAVADANPRHARLWQVMGLMHRSIDELGPAMEAFERASALAPADPLIAHGRARAALDAGRPARSLFTRAIELAPGDHGAALGLAAAMVADGKWDDAAAMLETRLRARPEWAAGHATLARLRWTMGDRERFVASLDRALLERPRDIQLWRELFATLVHAERFDDALEMVERGRAVAGSHSLFDANEAICLAEKGEFEKADSMFAALSGLADPTLAIRHVRLLLRSGRIAEAAAKAEGWLSSTSASAFWPYLAAAWRLLGDERWEWLEGQAGLVGVYELAGEIESLDALAERLRALHNAVGQPLDQSVRGGTQTDGMLFARIEPEIRALRRVIVEAVNAHVAGLPPPDPRHPQLGCPRTPIRFAGAWSVRIVGAGHHANHVHPAGWFSSAFYVALPDEDERGGGDSGWLTLGEPQAELGLALPAFRTIEPQPGRLALFPATMWHGTRPIAAGERLTVAFDVARPASC